MKNLFTRKLFTGSLIVFGFISHSITFGQGIPIEEEPGEVQAVCQIPLSYYGQPNLILNGSFEENSICPSFPGQINATSTPVCHWYQPQNPVSGYQGSSDYFNACNNTPCVYSTIGPYPLGVPCNYFGDQPARTGSAYTGLILCANESEPSRREYLRQVLPQGKELVGGRSYYGEYWVSAADRTGGYINSFGMDISTTEPAFVGSNSVTIVKTPKIQNNSYINNRFDWVKVSGSFVAQGGEKFVTIGNFKDKNSSGLITQSGANSGLAMYYIEDVSLFEVPYTVPDFSICHSGPFTEGQNLIAGTPLPSYLNPVYRWSWADGLVLRTQDSYNFYANPSETTTYTLQVFIDNGATLISTKSVTINVDNPSVVPQFTNWPSSVPFGGLSAPFNVTPTNAVVTCPDGTLIPTGNPGEYRFQHNGTTAFLCVRITATITNSCGTLSNYRYMLVGAGCARMSNPNPTSLVYPNPASDKLTIETTNSGSYTLYDSYGKEVKSGKIDREKNIVETKKLKKGLYYLHIKTGNEVEKQQIMIE